jgi:hypothetical protein
MKTALRLTTLLASIGSVTAVASSNAHATPRAGTDELRLENAVIPGISLQGLNTLSDSGSGSGSSSVTLFGAGVGLGRFVSDNFEVGGGVQYFNIDGSAQLPGANVFARFFKLVAPSTAFYAGGAFSYLHAIPSSGSSSYLLSYGGDLGIEQFITDSWAIRVGGQYRRLTAGSASATSDITNTTSSINSYGLNWGIAAYF